MRRKLFGILGALAVLLAPGLVLAGCATTSDAGRYDYASPEEDDSVIVILPGSYPTLITEFDGQAVSWRAATTLAFFSESFRIRVPSGEHTLTGGTENSQRPGELVFTTSTKYNFVKGKVYSITIANRNFRIVESADTL
jgi:hypothetical protein